VHSVRRRALSAIATRLYRHPIMAGLVIVALTALSVWAARGLEISRNLRVFLPLQAEEQSAWQAADLLGRPQATVTAEINPSDEGVVEFLVDACSDDEFVVAIEHWPDGGGFEIHPPRAASDLLFSMRFTRFLEDTVEALRRREENPLGDAEVALHGKHIEAARLARDFRSDLFRSGVVLLVCGVLLLILAFRKAEAVGFVGLPPCVGLVWTFGLVGYFQESISLLSVVYAILLLALGLEYSVQLYHRFLEELYREHRYYLALGTAFTEAGRGVFASASTTAVVFLSLLLSSFHGLREMALVGGLGICSMACASLLVLPPLAAIKSRLARGRVDPAEVFGFGLPSLSAAVTTSPRTTLVLGLIVTTYLAFFARDVEVNRETGLDLGVTALSSERLLSEDDSPGPGPTRILVEAESLEQALACNDRLTENLNQLPRSWGIEPVVSLDTKVSGSFQERVIRTENAARVLTTIHPDIPLSGSRFDAFVEIATRGLHPSNVRFESEFVRNREVSNAVIYSMALTVLVSAAALVLCLLLHFRWRLTDAILTLLPLLCATVWTFGLLALIDFRVGLYALLIFPLVIGIGMNQATQLIQRLHDRRYATLRQVLRSGGRPVVRVEPAR